MSTTTCVQVDELQKRPSTFHRYLFSDTATDTTISTRLDEQSVVSDVAEPKQKVLLLKGAREQYTLVNDHSIPSILHPGEILVKVGLS